MGNTRFLAVKFSKSITVPAEIFSLSSRYDLASRIATAERKRRTRRLILIGSYLEHVTGDDPDKQDRLMKGLDVFLERERDRELFDLPPNKENENVNPS